jgi:hypothetical protein
MLTEEGKERRKREILRCDIISGYAGMMLTVDG